MVPNFLELSFAICFQNLPLSKSDSESDTTGLKGSVLFFPLSNFLKTTENLNFIRNSKSSLNWLLEI